MTKKIIEVSKFRNTMNLKKGLKLEIVEVCRYDESNYHIFKVVLTRVLKTIVYAAFPDDTTNECFKFRIKKHFPLEAIDLGETEFFDDYLVDDYRKYTPFAERLINWNVL